MPTETPAIPPPDEKDWTWVLREPCPECGFDAAALERAELPGVVRDAAATIRLALSAPDAARRPSPEVWSALEYGCHVRDVCRIFGGRLQLMLDEDDPPFDNWDQDETALADRYWEQDPVVVADELRTAADHIADAYEHIPAAAWTRPGRRSNGSVFTVDSLGRYFTHDLVHHVHDIDGPAH
jgi:hypothetical protein